MIVARGNDDANVEPRRSRKATTPPDPRARVVRVRAGSLHDALKDLAGVTPGRFELPILGHVLFVVSDERTSIELTASDLDLWAVRDLACERGEDGERGFAICLPAKPLREVIAELDPDAMVP